MSVIRELNEKIDKLTEAVIKNGGKGSGNFGHAGRAGEIGGSAPSGTAKESGSAKVTPKVKKAMQESFKDYYVKEYPDDYQLDRIKDVTFLDIAKGMAKGRDIYDIIGDVDSVIRERAFAELEDRSGLDYDAFYDTWLGKDTKRSKALQDFLKAF